MRSFNRGLDRFCYKHPKLGIPNLMRYIIIGNVLVYLLSMMDTTQTFQTMLAFVPAEILRGQIWRLVTFIFVPTTNNLLFYALTLYFYYIIGNALEREWGAVKFTIFYFSGVVLTTISALLLGILTGSAAIHASSAYYINLSMFFAFATLYPDFQVLLLFILPIKMKWLALFSAALFVWEIFATPFPLNMLPLVALLNYFIFFAPDIIAMVKKLFRRYSPRTIRFKKAAKRASQKRSGQAKGYLHKCAVCGKNDIDHPGLDFRYCSRCKGYFCYCMDHIHNHVHVE